MRSNALLSALVGVLLLGCVGTTFLAARHFFTVIALEKLTIQAVTMNSVDTSAQALANETIAYSKRNPAITSILEQFRRKKPTPLPEAPVAEQTEGLSPAPTEP